jgi:hypothetical protein
MNYDQNDCRQFSFITPLFSDMCRHTKNKSWRRCRLYFRGRMQCWWIFDFETDYTLFNLFLILKQIIFVIGYKIKEKQPFDLTVCLIVCTYYIVCASTAPSEFDWK